MRDTKCLGLLTELTEQELINFKDYLKERYRPKKLMVRIFNYFIKNKEIIRQKNTAFDMPVVYKKICRKDIDTNRKKTFQNALSALYQDLVDFLLLAEVNKDSFERDWLLLKVFQQRNQKKAADKIVQSRLEKLRTIPDKEQWHYLQMMQLNELRHFNNYDDKVGINTNPLIESMDCLDSFHSISKLQYSCEMKNRTKILPESYDFPMLKETVNYLKKKNNQQPLEKLYTACLQLIEPKEKKSFKKVLNNTKRIMDLLDNDDSLLSKRDQLAGYGYLENHLVQQIRAGDSKAREQLFVVHQKGLKQEIYIYEGYMIAGQFNNIIHNACKLKEFDLAKEILNTYQVYLPEPSKLDWFNLLNATIYFEEGHFDKAWEALASVHFQNDHLALRGKALLLRCFYELGESEPFVSRFCNAFYTFIKKGNRQLSPKTLGHYLMLIKYIKMLIRRHRILSKVELEEQIRKEKYKLFAPWLLAKVSLLDD